MSEQANERPAPQMDSAIATPPLTGYNLVWRLASPFLGLILKWRSLKGKENPHRIGERFGRYEHNPIPPGAIWLHAVSVGESVAALALVNALSKRLPQQHFLITTNTVTAAAMIERTSSTAAIHHLYQPLDHPSFVDRFLTHVKPAAAIFMESDFWPNLITRSKAIGVPVIFASSQLSETAVSRWRHRASLASAMFGAADLALPVNHQQRDILHGFGLAMDRIKTIGSLKMAVAALPVDSQLCDQLRAIANGRAILLAASTHDGEDSILLDAAEKLGDNWLVIIAPRHPERGSAIAGLCQQRAWTVAQRSKGALPATEDRVYVMDSLGEMGSLFTLCDVVFLAGSLLPIGGHNPLEPASFGKPIITGNHVFKNSAEFDAMRQDGLIIEAMEADQIASAARRLHDDEEQLMTISKKASAYVAKASNRQDQAALEILSLLTADHTAT